MLCMADCLLLLLPTTAGVSLGPPWTMTQTRAKRQVRTCVVRLTQVTLKRELVLMKRNSFLFIFRTAQVSTQTCITGWQA